MTGSGAQAPPVEAGSDITLRPLRTHAELMACVALQRATWGARYEDIVPASILKVSQLVGGVSGGAFEPGGRLVGFVYGLTGVREGQLIHWSHMLAVTPEYRNHGVGRRLKEYQRSVLREVGVEMMYWTFDPLVARNAHLNLSRLGAAVDAYVPDMYGDTGSELHAFGTDRFVVSWAVGSADGAARADAPVAWHEAPFAGNGGHAADAPLLRVEIPADVETMAVADARKWRSTTRPVFLELLGGGYRVAGFVADGRGCSYVLERAEDAE